jgi:hypothetical protein
MRKPGLLQRSVSERVARGRFASSTRPQPVSGNLTQVGRSPGCTHRLGAAIRRRPGKVDDLSNLAPGMAEAAMEPIGRTDRSRQYGTLVRASQSSAIHSSVGASIKLGCRSRPDAVTCYRRAIMLAARVRPAKQAISSRLSAFLSTVVELIPWEGETHDPSTRGSDWRGRLSRISPL